MKFRRSSHSRKPQLQRRILRLEGLEPRHMMTASVDLLSAALASANDEAATVAADDDEVAQQAVPILSAIDDVDVPGTKTVLVPLTGLDPDGQPITYTFSKDNDNVTLALMSAASQSIRFNITGTDIDGNTFTGSITLKLFEDMAPATTARIKQLVQQGFYSNKTFHRVIDGFMAQAGTNSGTQLADEFSSGLTFVSRGLFAMANAGNDTGDSQFFITATDVANSNTPIDLDDMPQHLNYQHTIFGQLVSGFDIFQKIMQVEVEQRPGSNPPEFSQPVELITITSAEVITDTQNAVLRIVSNGSFTGEANITVTARTTSGDEVQQTFTATAVADDEDDPPFLNPVINHTATAGVPFPLTLTSTDPSGNGVAYRLFSPTGGAPANMLFSVNNNTGVVTITPSASFTGTITLLAGVRPASAEEAFGSYDTQSFTITVNANTSVVAAPTELAVLPSSLTGPFDDAGYVSSATPTLTVNAVTGATVRILSGTTVVATATETAAGSGVYRATLPAGTLAVGANSFTATAQTSAGASENSTALSLTFAPDYAGGVYVVPGAAAAAQSLTIAWTSKNAAFNNEFGYVVVDSATSAIGGTAPTDANYAQALLASGTRRVIFARGAGAGATQTVTLTGGQFVVFYMIQNNTTANFLARNATNALRGNNNSNAPLAFFSVPAANPDDVRHAQIIADPTTGFVQYNWEDLAGGDSDYNDAAITVRMSTQTTASPAGVRAPGNTGNTTVSGTLRPGSQSSPLGDVGVFFVDNPSGAIGSLLPGSSGYAAAALAAANSMVLFPVGATGARTIDVPAGRYLGFYTISSGTTANWRTANSTNSATGSAVAMFSFDDANPDDLNHFRWVSPGTQQANPDVMQLHVNAALNNAAGFDSYAIDVRFMA